MRTESQAAGGSIYRLLRALEAAESGFLRFIARRRPAKGSCLPEQPARRGGKAKVDAIEKGYGAELPDPALARPEALQIRAVSRGVDFLW